MLLIHQVQHIYNLAQIREIYKMVSRKKTEWILSKTFAQFLIGFTN